MESSRTHTGTESGPRNRFHQFWNVSSSTRRHRHSHLLLVYVSISVIAVVSLLMVMVGRSAYDYLLRTVCLLSSWWSSSSSSLTLLTSTSTSSSSLGVSIAGESLGDGKRSAESSFVFFKSIDRNGDGILKENEIELYLEDKVGGTSFDTRTEIQSEASNVMKDLNRNIGDEGLDKSDVYAYWNRLEKLLTVEEVGEWIIYAVQLPEYVGKIFKENGVTGYDFPELVEHDGLPLRDDLGISKATFRKKIVRYINARLLGVGTVPDAISRESIHYELESCTSIRFQWTKPDARGFPVHSYRIQRRHFEIDNALPGDSDNNNNNNNNLQYPMHPMHPIPPQHTHMNMNMESTVGSSIQKLDAVHWFPMSGSGWTDIYTGSEHQLHDNSLRSGFGYNYRLQAWNSVGRSDWTEIDVSDFLIQHKCSVNKHNHNHNHNNHNNHHNNYSQKRQQQKQPSQQRRQEILEWLSRGIAEGYWLSTLMANIVRIIFTLSAMGAAFMRFQRASVPTTSSVQNYFDYFALGLPHKFIRILLEKLGFRLPMDMDDSDHDVSVHAVGLHGYKNYKRSDSSATLTEGDTPSQRRIKLQLAQAQAIVTQQQHQQHISSSSSIKQQHHQQQQQQQQILQTKEEELSLRIWPTTTSSSTSPRRQRRILKKAASEKSLMIHQKANFLKKSISQRSLCKDCSSNSSEETISNNNKQRRIIKKRRSHIITSSQSERQLQREREREREQMSTNIGLPVDMNMDMVDDHTRCNTCHKKYKFGKRWKHHCAKCLSTFCHKHGRITHSNLTSCKVPGSCLCNVCLASSESSRTMPPTTTTTTNKQTTTGVYTHSQQQQSAIVVST